MTAALVHAMPRRLLYLLASVLLLLVALSVAPWAAWSGDASAGWGGSGSSGTGGSPTASAEKPAGSHGASLLPDEPERTEVATPSMPAIDRSAPEHGIGGRLLQEGRGLAGAEVRVLDMRWPQQEVAHAATDGQGSFSLSVPAGRYHLQFQGAAIPRGFGFQLVEVTARLRDLGDVIVPRGATVRGRVLDDEGQPLIGALIHGSGQESRIESNRSFMGVDPGAQSGADGRFVLGNLWPGPLRIWICCLDHQSHFVQADVEPGACGDLGDLVLHEAAALRGIVVDQEGVPIAGARVTTVGWNTDLPPDEAVITDRSGSFVLRSFSGNRSELRVDCDGFENAVCQCLESRPEPMRVVLRPSLELTGTVTGTSGHPGVLHVAHEPQNGSHPQYPIAADGSFRVPGLPAGRWVVWATIPGVGSVAPVMVELPQQTALELRPVADRQVAVAVVDDLGVAQPQATLVRIPATESS
jgi:hypothetical protein